MNIVVSDNNKNSRELMHSHLEKLGFKNVYCCENLSNIDCDLKNIDLIFFDVNSDNYQVTLAIIDELKNQYRNITFIATSYEINSELVSKVLKQNVSDFLIKPIIPNVLSVTIEKLNKKNSNKTTKKTKTISFFSNKGGCGKTSIAVNTAYEIANQTNAKVCLLDLSFNFGDVSTFLDVEPKYTIPYVIQKLEHSDIDLALSLCERYDDSNLYVLSFKDDSSLKAKYITPELVVKLINCLKNIFDYIIIDTSVVIDEVLSAVLTNSDVVMLIGMLNLISIRNCQKCIELLLGLNINSSRIKLVINRFIENSEIKIEDFQEATSMEIFHKIPNNYLTLVDAINMANAVSKINPNSNIAKAYKNLASEIVNIKYENLENSKNYNHGIFNFLRRMGE